MLSTHFGRTKFGRIDPNFLGYFIFSHHSYRWLLEFKTKHWSINIMFIYMHVLYMFVYSMDWFEDVWGNNVLLVKKNRGAGSWLIPSIIIYRLFFRGKPSEPPRFSSTNFNGKRTSIQRVPLSIFPWSNSTRVRTSNHPLGHANPLMSKQCPVQVWNDWPFKSLQPLWLNYSIQ